MDKQKLLIISMIGLSAAMIIGSLFYSKTSLLKPKTESQTNQSMVPSSPTVVCKRFTSLDEALKNVEIACVLDLSNQNLATVSAEITKLTKLNELSLKGNKLTSFPSVILDMPTLISLDLANNRIKQFPADLGKLTNLQILKLSGNNFPAKEKDKILKLFPKAEF